MPYTAAAKAFFGMCSSARGRAKARKKCPSLADAKKLAHESAHVATLPPVKKKKR